MRIAGLAVVYVSSAVAMVFGAICTLWVCWPGTDMADSAVLIRTGPLCAIGAVVALWLLRRRRV